MSDAEGGAPFSARYVSVEDGFGPDFNSGVIVLIPSGVAGGSDHFGFVAQEIGAVKIGGNAIPLAATNNPQPVGETADVDVHIIP